MTQRWFIPICCLLVLCGFIRPVSAAQILINPGDDWEKKAARARPGDEIILLPGRHRPATFERLHGAPGSPIVIRAAAKDKPTQIAATLDGLRIKDAAHIVIRDLQIVGGSASGVWLASAASQSGEALRAKDILIDNVSISRVGPRGQRHAMILSGFADVRLSNLRFEGWGGAAIELIACEDVSISRCQFKGLTDHSQLYGIRVRAGTDRVSISESRFENAGEVALCLGGRSSPEEFMPPLTTLPAPSATTAPAPGGGVGTSGGGGGAARGVSEAARVTIDQSVIMGSLCPVAFIHATDCVIRSTTIYRPQRCVFALLSQNADERVRSNARNIFGQNLIVWKSGEITRLVEIDDGVDAAAFILEANLWWSDDSPERRDRLGPLPGRPEQASEQVFDVDPRFTDSLRPTNPDARAFGVSI